MIDKFLMLAQQGGAQASAKGEQASGGDPVFTLGWLVVMIAIFYFVLIRPQRKREKERKELIASVKTGDKVLMTSGFMGLVSNVGENTFKVKIADNVKVEVVRSAIAQVITDETDLGSEQEK